MGKPYYFIAKCKQNKTVTKVIADKKIIVKQRAGEIAASGCAVLRSMKMRSGKSIPAWYICDLKVNEKYRGEHIPLIIVSKVALPRFLQCPRGFGICMNPPNRKPKAAEIFKKHGPVPWLETQTLNLYTLTAEEVNKYYDNLKVSLVKHGYMQKHEHLVCESTTGLKDYKIVDKTTDNSHAWKLFHLKPGLKRTELHEDVIYMISSVKGTTLDKEFNKI